MRMLSARLGLVLFVVSALDHSTARAATRTVCFQLKFVEDRSACPDASTPGARRPCGATGDLMPAVGHYVELWDKDTDAGDPDDKIGTWVKANQSAGCATFEWEQASHSHGETNPDVYLQYINMVRQTGCPGCVKITSLDGNVSPPVPPAPTTWREGTATDPDAYVAVDCTSGSYCWIANAPLWYLRLTSQARWQFELCCWILRST